MNPSSPTDRGHRPDAAAARPTVRVDRVACTGHGVCASLLPGSVRLDEWGYPVVLTEAEGGVDDGDRARGAAVRLCPAMALYAERRS
jgi:ferredoxin